jgi:trimeric autotransporter adhesin
LFQREQISSLNLGTGNQILGTNAGATASEYKSVFGTSNQITVTHAANSITISTPQDIHTGASPTFAGMQLSNITSSGNLTVKSAVGSSTIVGDNTGASSLALQSGTGGISLLGNTTITGTTTISGNTAIAGTSTFSTGTGSVALNGATTLAAAFTQNFTGITTTGATLNSNSVTSGSGLVVNANALTTGKGLSLSSTSAAFTSGGSLFSASLSGNASGGSVATIMNSSATSAAMGLYINNNGTAPSLYIEDSVSDATPFIIDQNGNVGVGKAVPVAALDVAGQVRSANSSGISQVSSGLTTIDWNNGNAQELNYDCTAQVPMTNMLDGGTYILAITHTTSTNMCDFAQAGLTYYYSPGNGPRTVNTRTVYTFQRIGTAVYVSWITGFQ